MLAYVGASMSEEHLRPWTTVFFQGWVLYGADPFWT